MVEHREDTVAEIAPEQQARFGFRLLSRLLVYHAVLALLVVLLILLFPGVFAELPIGGVSALVEGGDVSVSQLLEDSGGTEASATAQGAVEGPALGDVTTTLDRFGYARRLIITLVGLWLLMLPVSWVHKGIHARSSLHDHSLDETVLILPGVVAAIVLVVQHSLALAFSLAGIVAGVHFRRALQDTFDTLFILVAIGAGIAAGVEALEIAAILALFFSYATWYVYFRGDGLESDHAARKKLLKRQRRVIEAEENPSTADAKERPSTAEPEE